MADMESRLDKIESKIDTIAETLKTVAVQSERITNLQAQLNSHQTQIDALFHKADDLISPNGVLAKVTNHQASCPRAQVRWLWSVMIPIALLILGVGFKMFSS